MMVRLIGSHPAIHPSSPSQRPAATGVWTACIHGVLCICGTEYGVLRMEYGAWYAPVGTPVGTTRACEPRSRLDTR